MKKKLKLAAITLAAVVGVYFISISILYLAGYRVYRIPTAAMQPTIQKGEMVVGRLSESYRGRAQRFDLVVFQTPHLPGQIYTKRVIGLPGERITIDERGVMIDGRLLSLPGAVTIEGFELKKCDLVIPRDAVFLLGDYTLNSLDSRYLGPIPTKDLIGYLVFKK